MSASRTFPYESLERLIRDHPGWSHQQYADKITDQMREKDPTAPRIKVNTISVAIARYRPIWAERGVVAPFKPGGIRLLPWTGIPDRWLMDTNLRKLRLLARIDAGEDDLDPREVKVALKFRDGLRAAKQVVDLSPQGRPVVRAARPDEVDGTGELLSLLARHPGLSEKEWARMTPAEREQASSKWIAGDKQRLSW